MRKTCFSLSSRSGSSSGLVFWVLAIGLARPTLGDCSWAREAGNECGYRGLEERRSDNGNGNLMSRAGSLRGLAFRPR